MFSSPRSRQGRDGWGTLARWREPPPLFKGFGLIHPSVQARGRLYYPPIITNSGNHPRRFEETEYGKGGWRFAPATVSVVSDALLCKVSERGICQGHPRRRHDSTLFWPLEVETDNNGARLRHLETRTPHQLATACTQASFTASPIKKSHTELSNGLCFFEYRRLVPRLHCGRPHLLFSVERPKTDYNKD